MPTTQQPVTFTFQDPSGAPLAGGSVVLQLSSDIATSVVAGVQILAGRQVTGTLDSNGSCTLNLWPNSVMFPSGVVYFVSAYTASGLLVWSGELTV